MRKQRAPFIRASIGCLLAGVISIPAFSGPFSKPELAGKNGSTLNAESRNVPNFKMTYRSLHNASQERRKRADMGALEIRGKTPSQKIEGKNKFLY